MDANKQRVADIEGYLSRVGDALNPSLKAAALYEQAYLLQSLGKAPQAMWVLRTRLLPLLIKMGDEDGQARARARMADISAAQGHFEEAVRLLSEEVIPVFERLGNEGAHIFAMARMARILEQKNSNGTKNLPDE
jgi:hypothetical protein